MTDFQQKRFLWQARRGMLELDMFFIPFITEEWERLSLQEKNVLQALLTEPDQVLFAWLTDRETPENPEFKALITQIQSFSKGCGSI